MGPYSLGFFAAITIEADDVVLDLNNKTVEATFEMALKQVCEGRICPYTLGVWCLREVRLVYIHSAS